MKTIVVITGLLCLCLAGTNALAQSRISGTVNDASGALIPGVTVTATNTSTAVITTEVSNETGAYNFASLQPGTYKVTAELPGFHTDTMGFNLLNSGFCTLQSIAAQNGDATTGPVVFQNPFPGHRGNMPFGLNAPGQYRFDANLSKRFKIGETKWLQLRLDALNVFNHPGVGDPQPRTAGGQSINTPGIVFGQIPDKGVLGSGANPQMRYITGQLRLDF